MRNEDRNLKRMMIMFACIDDVLDCFLTRAQVRAIIMSMSFDVSTRAKEKLLDVLDAIVYRAMDVKAAREVIATALHQEDAYDELETPASNKYSGSDQIQSFINQILSTVEIDKPALGSMTFPMNDEPFEHRVDSGVVFTGKCDLKDGVHVDVPKNQVTHLDIAEFIAWHAIWIHRELNGFSGYIRINFIYAEEACK